MHKKYLSCGDSSSFKLTSPHPKPPSFPKHQAFEKFSPIHSPPSHIQAKTSRLGIPKSFLSPNNKGSSDSLQNDPFYLLQGFLANSDIQPPAKSNQSTQNVVEQRVHNPVNVKTRSLSQSAGYFDKNEVNPLQNVFLVANQGDKMKGLRKLDANSGNKSRKSSNKDKVAWPSQAPSIISGNNFNTPSLEEKTRMEEIKKFFLVQKDQSKESISERIKAKATNESPFVMIGNHQNDKKLIKKNIKEEENGKAETEKIMPKALDLSTKIFWRNKDTSAHLASSARKTNRTSIGNIQENLVTKKAEKNLPKNFKKLTISIKSEDSPLSNSRPKTARTVKNQFDLKKCETTRNCWGLSSMNTMTNFDSPNKFFATPSSFAGSTKEGLNNQLSVSPSIVVNDQNIIKSWNTFEPLVLGRKEEYASIHYDLIKQSVAEAYEKSKFSKGVSEKITEEKIRSQMNAHGSGLSMEDKSDEEDLEADLDFLERRMKPKTLVQQDVYKSSTQGMARMQSLPNEAKNIEKQIEKLQFQFFRQVVINRSKIVELPREVYVEMFKSERRRLTDLDIRVIQEEFKNKEKEDGFCDYGKVDKLIKVLKFFSNLDKFVRIKILKSATYIKYEAGKTIFKQGDDGDLMYIILKGAVNVKVTRLNKYNKMETNTVGVLYDGSYFGENALVLTPEEKEGPLVKTGNPDRYLDSINREMGVDWSLNPASARGFVPREEPDPSNLDEIAERLNLKKKQSSKIIQEKRAATIEVSESCDLLCIPRMEYQLICVNFIQKEVDAKLKALHCLPFLNELDRFTLLAIANNLVSRKYQYGEIILSAGQEIDRLRIISSGKCKLLLGLVHQTALLSPLHDKQKGDSKGWFNTGMNDYSCKETQMKDNDDATYEKTIKRVKEIWEHSKRSFDFDKIGVSDGKLLYLEHVSLGFLAKGAFFGGRALLSKGDFIGDQFEKPKMACLTEPAKVSVVADSASVEIFELSKENFEFVPEFLGKILKLGLKAAYEFDEFDIDKEANRAIQWNKFKEKELKQLAKAKEGNLIENLKKSS